MGSSGINAVHGECSGHHTALNMNQIILVVALFGSLVLSDEVVRKPKLFFVSTSATTSALQTASICYLSTAAYVACNGRKRRAITAFSEMETEIQPKQDEVDSSLQEAESGGRDGRFLLYWITTTSISTSTSYTVTYTISSVGCTPAGANDCGR